MRAHRVGSSTAALDVSAVMGPNSENSHQPQANLILTGNLLYAPVQPQILLIQRHPGIEQRHKGMSQNVIHFDDRRHDVIKAAMRDGFGQADAKYLQQSTGHICQIHPLLKQRLACANQRTKAMSFSALQMNRTEPASTRTSAMPLASFLSVLFLIADRAAFTCRASMQTNSKPAACSPK